MLKGIEWIEALPVLLLLSPLALLVVLLLKAMALSIMYPG
jgi:hypothetical protein